MMEFDKDFLGALFEQAVGSPRRRQVCDLRTSPQDAGRIAARYADADSSA